MAVRGGEIAKRARPSPARATSTRAQAAETSGCEPECGAHPGGQVRRLRLRAKAAPRVERADAPP
eukprot:9633693-Alexandrium_andersonii.AAC.1